MIGSTKPASGLPVIKAHAYGNDFLFVRAADLGAADPGRVACELCDRHRGIGGDGLIVYTLAPDGAEMRLYNADGGAAEISGNGVRCLAAILARERARDAPAPPRAVGETVHIQTIVGTKTLTLIERARGRLTFRAAMGAPENIELHDIPVLGETLRVTTLRVGNPQCVVLGPLPDPARFERLGPALERHAIFPAGTNVEFAQIEAADRIRILIWERGVGPTAASGTGACAAAIAAAAHGGGARAATVISPGGEQRVEWRQDGVYLTGWAEVLLDGVWLRLL